MSQSQDDFGYLKHQHERIYWGAGSSGRVSWMWKIFPDRRMSWRNAKTEGICHCQGRY